MKQSSSSIFLERLQDALDRAHLNNRAMAAKMGRHESTVGKWIKGVAQPNLDDLALIAEVTGVTVDWLLGAPAAPSPPDLPPSVSAAAVRRLLRAVERLADEARHLAGELPEEEEGDAAQPPTRRTPTRKRSGSHA
jgi:transcriptional regulator with XRE-family HTH domain